ncbi:MAG: ATP-dependent metallopeptidase FtsH/Yme1/Tma family protein [Gammaproteobacteria bacterium]|nr:MAG: ATP-dependent metallopeptidase FtsH/Yme1/Tma family protein [Gammaproteobacteria bacterium]
MSELLKNLLMWLFIAITVFSVFNNLNTETSAQELSYSEFISQVESDQVLSVEFASDNYTLKGKTVNGESFETVRPPFLQDDLSEILSDHRVAVTGERPEEQSVFKQLLIASFPILIILAVFIFFMRQMQGGMGGKSGPMSFGKSKAKMLEGGKVKTSFADVAGVEEAKEEVQEVVDFLKDPTKFQKLGGKIPTGILMTGSPGTGKTLLAKAIAGEAGVPFFTISGSDFVEMFVGVGASRVRDMFEQAKRQSPCIVFIDEIDAVGRHRGAGMGGGHDEREQTLNQLLVEMDGFEDNQAIIIIAATNRPDVLDPALLRPGRFDRQVVVPLPDIRGREQILKVHMKKVPIAQDVDASLIARGTPGFSGADLANLVNEAALVAARTAKKLVGMEQLEFAKDKVMMGAERRSMVMSEEEKLKTAYHESGHAIVGRSLEEHDPVYKVTIIPRGRALGVTMFLPEEDKYSYSHQSILDRICGLYGGRIAEELIYGEKGVTTGASNDIERATELAHNMVTKWGLSEKLGPIKYGDETDEPFLGRSAGASKQGISDDTAHEIDNEVKTILSNCYQHAKDILSENIEALHAMSKALMDYETLDVDQIDDIMAGGEPRAPQSTKDSKPSNPEDENKVGDAAEQS